MPAQKRVLKISNERTTSAKGKTIADQCPQHGDQRHQREALHHDRQHVLMANQAAVEQSEARTGHHQYKCGADQHPGVIRGRLSGRHSLVKLVKFVRNGFGYFSGGG